MNILASFYIPSILSAVTISFHGTAVSRLRHLLSLWRNISDGLWDCPARQYTEKYNKLRRHRMNYVKVKLVVDALDVSVCFYISSHRLLLGRLSSENLSNASQKPVYVIVIIWRIITYLLHVKWTHRRAEVIASQTRGPGDIHKNSKLFLIISSIINIFSFCMIRLSPRPLTHLFCCLLSTLYNVERIHGGAWNSQGSLFYLRTTIEYIHCRLFYTTLPDEYKDNSGKIYILREWCEGGLPLLCCSQHRSTHTSSTYTHSWLYSLCVCCIYKNIQWPEICAQ